MPLSAFGLTRRAFKVVAACATVALVAAACGGSDVESPRTAVSEVAELEEVAEVFTAPQDVDPIPTPHAPDLLELEAALALARLSSSETADAPSSVALAEDEAEETATTEPQPEGSDLDGGVEVDGAGAGGESGESDESAEAAEEPPAPPPPTGPQAAPYPDPSAMLAAAAGREFSPADNPDVSTRGVTATTVTIGGLASETLAGYVYRVDTCLGAEARFNQANEHAELGRTIDFAGCYDDAGQADLTEGLAGTLVSDEVFAVAPLASPAFGAERVLTEAGVPYVGDDALPAFCGRANHLGFGVRGARGCPVLEARGFATLAEPVFATYMAARNTDALPEVVYAIQDGPAGQAVAAARGFEAELLSISEPTFLAVLPSAADGVPADWEAAAAALMAADAGVIFLEGPVIAGLPPALRQAGFEGEVVFVGLVDPLDVAEDTTRLELAPLTVITPGLDVASRSSEGWQAVLGAAAAVGVAETEIGLDFVHGYLAADFLVRAMGAAPEPLNGSTMASHLNQGWWYSGVEGLSCGSWWPASHLITVPCAAVARVDVFSDVLRPDLGLVHTEPQIRFELASS